MAKIKILLKYISQFAGCSATLITLFAFISNMNHNKTELNVDLVSTTLLDNKTMNVKKTKIDTIGFFSFRPSIRITKYVITNVGRESIYSANIGGNIIDNDLISLSIDNTYSYPSVTITKQNAAAKLMFKFIQIPKQWRHKEYIELTIISDGTLIPNLRLNSRDVKDLQITYTDYYTNKEIERGFFDKIPDWLYYLCLIVLSFTTTIWLFRFLCLISFIISKHTTTQSL